MAPPAKDTSTRAYSPISVDGDNGSQGSTSHSAILLTEKKVFRSGPGDTDEDDWASVDLVDVTVKGEDGKIGNLLNAEYSDSGLTVCGKLEVDEDNYAVLKDLKNPRYNGQYIKFKTYGFAIGFPKGLWAKGENRWFELEPSNEYRSMYNSMIEAIELYFAIDNLHGSERDKKSRKRSAIQIVESLCKISHAVGSGTNLPGIIQEFDNHAEFLISQMRKHRVLGTSDLFKWLANKHIETYHALCSKVKVVPLRLEHIDIGHFPEPVEIVDILRIRTPSMPPTSNPQPASSPSAGSNYLIPNSTRSTGFPSGSNEHQILSLLFGAVESGNLIARKLSLSRAANLLNKCYSIRSSTPVSDYNFGKAILLYYGPSLRTGLINAGGEDYSLSELAQTLAKDKFPGGLLESGEQTVTVEKEINVLRLTRRKNTNSRKQQTVPAQQNMGSVSGKRAVLRPVQRVAKRSSAFMASEDSAIDIDVETPIPSRAASRGRSKRRRGSSDEIEMGEEHVYDPNLDPELVAIDRASRSPSADKLVKKTFKLSLRSTPLPSTSPTGPNGDWVCPQCPFIVRDGGSEDGQDAIFDHLAQHSSVVLKEDLVAQEAISHRFDFMAPHLLEHLKARGQAARPVELAPIKRSGI